MTVPTPPAVSEAMREAVAREVWHARYSDREPKEVAERILAGPIASEIARLTGDLKVAREQRDSLKIALSDEVEAHVEAGEQLAAAEAALSRLQADQDAEVGKLARIETPRPISEYHEDMGFCLWWILPVREPPYSGSPLCDDWPEYHTHFTPLPEIRDAAWREAYYATPETPDA